jgi:hypothetical protein
MTSVLVIFLDWDCRLPGWKRVEWRRQSARDLPVPAIPETAENDHDDEDEKD